MEDNTQRATYEQAREWIAWVRSYRWGGGSRSRNIADTERRVSAAEKRGDDLLFCEPCGGPAIVTSVYKRNIRMDDVALTEYHVSSECAHCSQRSLGALVTDPYWHDKAIL